MEKTILVTGGMGFIGSNFIRFFRQSHPEDPLVNLDKLTYSANPENLADLSSDPLYRFVQGDILDEKILDRLIREFSIRTVIHFAAESHVDRSILGSKEFIQTNMLGTYTLLVAFRNYWQLRNSMLWYLVSLCIILIFQKERSGMLSRK